MERIKELQELINAKESEIAPMRIELKNLLQERYAQIEYRINRCLVLKDKFIPDDLRFAAATKCNCGARMAYVKDASMHSAWHCSAILLGEANIETDHTGALPFSMYEIKSES